MRSVRKLRLLLVLVFAALPWAGSARVPAEKSCAQQILWMDAQEHKSAMFIPERVLNEHSPAELPLNQTDRSAVESMLEYALEQPKYIEEYKRRTGRNLSLCPPARVDERSRDAMSLLDLSKKNSLTFVATIEEVVPGWSLWERKPVSMVYVKPKLLLSGKLPKKSRSLVYRELWGSIIVGGMQVCEAPPAGRYRAQKGDTVLVIGDLFPPNPLVFDGAFVFPVEDGKVLPQSYSTVKDFTPLAIVDLRRDLEKNLEQK